MDDRDRRADRRTGASRSTTGRGGARTINYKATGTSRQPDRVAGTLGMSFSDSKYDIFYDAITFINCAGSQFLEAVPAG